MCLAPQLGGGRLGLKGGGGEERDRAWPDRHIDTSQPNQSMLQDVQRLSRLSCAWPDSPSFLSCLSARTFGSWHGRVETCGDYQGIVHDSGFLCGSDWAHWGLHHAGSRRADTVSFTLLFFIWFDFSDDRPSKIEQNLSDLCSQRQGRVWILIGTWTSKGVTDVATVMLGSKEWLFDMIWACLFSPFVFFAITCFATWTCFWFWWTSMQHRGPVGVSNHGQDAEQHLSVWSVHCRPHMYRYT